MPAALIPTFTVDGQSFLFAIAQSQNVDAPPPETREQAAAALILEDRNSGRQLRELRDEMRESRADRQSRW